MNRGGRIILDIGALVTLFAQHCADTKTLEELRALVDDAHQRWGSARQIFERIRGKSLMAYDNRDALAIAQYQFEEVCAKTLYNLSGGSAPFDADSPYWIIPSALALARQLGLPDSAVTSRTSI